MNFDFDVIQRSWVYLFTVGMRFTLELTVLAMLGGLIFGTALAMMRLSRFSVPLEAQDASYLAASARISSLRCTSIRKSL